MDDLLDFTPDAIRAEAGAPPTQRKAAVPPELLDGLRQVESSGDPHAVNPQTGAMGAYQFMPGTVAMLHKQGIKFDPFDEKQARGAAETYLGQLIDQNGGDVKKALAQYGGFVSKAPNAYVAKVLAQAGNAVKPQGVAQGVAPTDLLDFTPDAIRAEAASVNPGQSTPANPAGTPANPTPMTLQPPDMVKAGSDLRGVALNQLTGLGSGIVGGYRGLSTLLTGGSMDDAANAVRDYQQAHTYSGSPDAEASFGSSANPANWVGLLTNKAGEVTTDLTGSPGAGATVNAGLNGAALLLGMRGRPMGGTRLSDLVRPAEEPLRIEPTMDAAKPRYRLGVDGQPILIQPTMPIKPASPVAMERVPSVTADANPAPTGARVSPPAPGSVASPAEAFREIEPADQPITDAAERLRRAKVLQSVGIDTTRDSALAGDRLSGSTDLQFSKVDSPGGRMMGGVLDSEKSALQQHAEQLVHETGGTLDKDQTTAYQRGDAITQPLKELNDYYDGKARDLYNAADARAQGVPVKLDSFGASLNDPSLITQPSHPLLQNAVKAKAKQIGMEVAEDGSISGTAKQAEVLRKYLNQNGKGANAGFSSAMKEALDNDVMSSAGDDLYTQARRLWAEKKNTLDNPNGIAKLMQEEGPNGINRPIPLEQVAPKLAKMPVDQFGHVVDTLKNAPPEVSASANAALSEIKAHFANEVRNIGGSQKGQWAADKVTRYLRDNAARMNQVFTPEEMAKFQNLSEAGQIVAKDQSYPGAAAQAANLGKAGALPAILPYAGAAAGGFVGHVAGPVGAVGGSLVGRLAGEKASAGMAGKASLKAAQGRTVKLSDLLDSSVRQ